MAPDRLHMITRPEEFKKHVATGLLLVLGLFLIYLLRIFFLAVFGAYLFSFMFAPVYIWIKKKIGREELAAIVTVLIVLLVALVPLLALCYKALNQAVSLQDRFNLKDFSILFTKLSPAWRAKVDVVLQNAGGDLSATLTHVLPSIFAAASNLVVSLFVMFFMMYYIFLNLHYIFVRSAEYLPFSQSNAIWLVRQFEHISKAILLGQILVSGLQGLMGGIAFYVVGLPDAVLWGIVMAVLSLVPVVGTSLVWLPASLYLLAQRNYFAGIGLLLWCAIIVCHIDSFVRPKLGKKLGNIHPIVMLLGAFAGLNFFGIVGIVVGPLLLAFFLLLLQVYRQEYLGHPAALSRAQVLVSSRQE